MSIRLTFRTSGSAAVERALARSAVEDRSPLFTVLDAFEDFVFELTRVVMQEQGEWTAERLTGEVIDIGAGIAGTAQRPRFYLDALGNAVHENRDAVGSLPEMGFKLASEAQAVNTQ